MKRALPFCNLFVHYSSIHNSNYPTFRMLFSFFEQFNYTELKIKCQVNLLLIKNSGRDNLQRYNLTFRDIDIIIIIEIEKREVF